MELKKLESVIESVLFVYGESMPFKVLGKITESKEDDIEMALKALEERYEESDKGLVLIIKDKKAQIATNPSNASYVENIIKEGFDKNLTPVALETLTIIAYLGPVSRAQIDYIRGVNSSFILRNLLIRGLIEKELDKKRKYVILYKITSDTLKFLGIEGEEDLPDYDKYKDLLRSKEINHE